MIIENTTYQVLTTEGYKDFAGYKLSSKSYIVLEFEDTFLECTPDHLIFSLDRNDWIEAQDLKVGENLRSKDGGKRIIEIRPADGEIEVVDLLEVEDTHSFIANDIDVHNCVFVDEAAFVPTNVWEEFYKSTYPTISSGTETKFILVSTPNGLNHYHKLWVNANKKINEDGKSMYRPFSVIWSDVPGRDEKWKKEQIANQGEEAFLQEQCIQFLGSSNTLIPSSKLQSLVGKEPDWIDNKRTLRIYKHPEKGRNYVLVADTSHGKGLDYSAFSVIDISEYPYEQVAVFRDNRISTLLYPSMIFNTATKYNDADILCETNDLGQQVVDTLNYELEYENLFYLAPNNNKKEELGVRTTKSVKALGCSNLDDLIVDDKLILHDEATINELSGFVKRGSSYEADTGYNDDLVMGLVLFAWLTSHPYFKDLTNQDIRTKIFGDKIDELEEMLSPVGFIEDGLDSLEEDDRGYAPKYWNF